MRAIAKVRAQRNEAIFRVSAVEYKYVNVEGWRVRERNLGSLSVNPRAGTGTPKES